MADQEDREAVPPPHRGGMGVCRARPDESGPLHRRRSQPARRSITAGPTTTPISPTARGTAAFTGKRRSIPEALQRNAFGLHEMHGNVWEWVEDCYKDSYEGAPADGTAVTSTSCKLRILRGGAWNYNPTALRAAYRYATFPELRVNMAGFRIARTL